MDDFEPLHNGDGSPLPSGMSERASKKLRMLRERAGLKLNDLVLFLEETLDDFESIRYTKTCTSTHMANLIKKSANDASSTSISQVTEYPM